MTFDLQIMNTFFSMVKEEIVAAGGPANQMRVVELRCKDFALTIEAGKVICIGVMQPEAELRSLLPSEQNIARSYGFEIE